MGDKVLNCKGGPSPRGKSGTFIPTFRLKATRNFSYPGYEKKRETYRIEHHLQGRVAGLLRGEATLAFPATRVLLRRKETYTTGGPDWGKESERF